MEKQQKNTKNIPTPAAASSEAKIAANCKLNDAVSDEKIMLAVYNIG